MAAENRKIYYSMGEVAEMLDVTPTLLRFWEQKFDIIAPRKNKKGNRMFSPEDVRNLKTIYHLVKERGMTLAGADKYLKANRKPIERDMEIAERLHSIRALLVEVRQELGGEGAVVDDAVEETAGEDVEAKEKIVQIVEQAHEEEALDAMMEEAIEELAENEPEPEEEAGSEPEARPKYVEQTLF